MDSCEGVIIAVGATFQNKKRGKNENRSAPSIFPWGRGDDPEAIYNSIFTIIL
jgi:hypothetical protein